MTFLDWSIMAVPMAIVCLIAFKTNKYMKGVTDFLAAGRVAGRYLVCTASGMAGMGVISVVAAFERIYHAGFAINWWQQLGWPVGLLITLTGFVYYRYRETRALTLAQFFEMRYSRKFRIFAGILGAGAGIINYGIFPAVGGRFFVYFCGLPETIHPLGLTIPTFAIVMTIFLGAALFFVLMGGQLTIMVTDCVLGLFSYAMYLVVALALLWMFSWHQISTALLSFPVDQSMVNPFRAFKVADFNVWFEMIGIFGGVYTVMAWQGTQGFNASAASPHEQKMGGILGTWRGLVFEVMQTLLAICALTYLTSHDFSAGAVHVNQLIANIHGANPAERDYLQTQMRVPLALAYFLPIGIKGIFAALMFFLACTNDVSYLHSWGSIVAQDVVLPWREKPLSPRAHILLLRCCIIGVTIFAFCWSLFYHQVGYIRMYFAVTGDLPRWGGLGDYRWLVLEEGHHGRGMDCDDGWRNHRGRRDLSGSRLAGDLPASARLVSAQRLSAAACRQISDQRAVCECDLDGHFDRAVRDRFRCLADLSKGIQSQSHAASRRICGRCVRQTVSCTAPSAAHLARDHRHR